MPPEESCSERGGVSRETAPCEMTGVTIPLDGYLAHKKQPPPVWGHHRALDIVLL